jgi:hypothetical protein
VVILHGMLLMLFECFGSNCVRVCACMYGVHGLCAHGMYSVRVLDVCGECGECTCASGRECD